MVRIAVGVTTALTGLTLALGMPGPAQAVDPPGLSIATHQVLFAVPGTNAEADPTLENAFLDQMARTPTGAQVRLVTTVLSRMPATNAMIDAFQRGVDIQVIVDKSSLAQPATVALRSALPAERVTVCGEGTADKACIAPLQATNLNHNRFWTISETNDGAKDVVVQSGAQFNDAMLNAFQTMTIIRNDPTLFASYNEYWNDLKAQVKNANYYRTKPGENAELHMFPRLASLPDPVGESLANIDCNAPGGAPDGKGLIRFGGQTISVARTLVVDRLVALARAGCTVEYTASSYDTVPRARLMNAGVNFIRIRDQLTPSGVDITNQNKYHLIDATTTDGRRLQRGYVGSYELNSTGYTNTDETMLRIDDPAFVAALNAHFEVLKSRAFYRVAVPLPDRGVPFTDALTVSSPGAAGWFNSDVTVRLFSSDAQNGTGTREVRYQLAGANTSDVVITAGERASALLTNEGVTTISYWGLDNAGNTEARKSLTVKIDKTPPVVGVTAVPLPNAAGWNNTDVTVFFTASDPLSGVGGAPSSSRTLGEGAAQLVSATFTDLAGNTSTAHYTANVDRTDPTLTGMPADDCSIWPPDHTLRAVADVAGADALSGLAGFRLVATSSEPQFGTGTGDIGPDIFISGGHLILRAERSGLSTAGRIYSVAATVTDLAGNSASQTTTCLVSHDQSQLAANAAANPDRHLRNAVDRAAARAARDQAAAAAVAAWAAAQPQPGPTTFEDTPLGVATVAEPGELGDTIADAEPG